MFSAVVDATRSLTPDLESWLLFHCSARPALPSHLGTATPVITQITLYSTTADGQRCRPTTNKNTGVPSSSSFYISGDERSETPKRSRTVQVGLFLISRGWELSTRNPEGASRLLGVKPPLPKLLPIFETWVTFLYLSLQKRFSYFQVKLQINNYLLLLRNKLPMFIWTQNLQNCHLKYMLSLWMR